MRGEMGGSLSVRILVLTRLGSNKTRRLTNCGEVFLTFSRQFARRRFSHRQVVYV